MVRSGCVSSRSRASSPTTIFPLRSTLTTDGHRADPYGPGIVFGTPVCASMYAIRLYVVPRSIPTTLLTLPSRRCDFFLYSVHQIANVASSVQRIAHAHQQSRPLRLISAGIERRVPLRAEPRQFRIHFRQLLLKISSRRV